MKKSIILSALSCSLLFSAEELFTLSLEELINIEVTTSSQEKESIQEAPAIVSVLTAEQIEELGVQNIYEALSFLPGITVNQTYLGYHTVNFRGTLPGLYNTKALFMINSHPAYESLFGSGQIEYIPLEIIERVEVVRSPASSLYGTQAMGGVINIITKQGDENNNIISARAGSHDHYYGSLTLHSANVSMSASAQHDNGYNYNGTFDEFSNPVNLKDYKDINNIFLDVHDETWRIQAAYYDQSKMRLGLNPWIWNTGENVHESYYFDAKKSFQLADGNLDITLRYDNHYKELRGAQFPFPAAVQPALSGGKSDTTSTMRNKVKRYSGNITYKNKYEDIGYIIGASFEHDKTNPLQFTYDVDGTVNPNGGFPGNHTADNYAIFSQVKYDYSQKLHAILGLRVEDNSDNGTSKLIPRIGLTYELQKDSFIKALYAEAFRSPVFLEKHVYVPALLLGDPKLKREQIKTYELAYDSKINEKSTIQVALYYLEQSNIITRIPTQGTAAQYVNSSVTSHIYGIEANYNGIINKTTTINLNSSYKDGEDKLVNNAGDAPYIANITFNTTLSHALSSKWRTTIANQYVGAKDYYLKNGTSGKIDDYNLVNLTLIYENEPFRGSLALKNIFDEDYTYPEYIRRVAKDVPGGDGASAYLNIQYSF